ncbi:MFS transporter [SAR92 clade bacterium H231]|nr:MFS transporter [SAR92 clade bacterium H231]
MIIKVTPQCEQTTNKTEPLSSAQMMAYALPKAPVFFLLGPFAILPGIYAKYFGLGLTTIAAIIVLARVFDTITDPLIGYWSDKYYARRGSRKPFVFMGGVLFVISSYFLYVPVDTDALTATTKVSETYFLLWMFTFYLALTFFDIPRQAWGSEIAINAQERNKLYGFTSFEVTFTQALFFSLPLWGIFESSEFTPQTLQWSVLVAGFLLLPSLTVCLRTVPNGHYSTAQISGFDKDRSSLKLSLLCLAGNQPFLLFLLAFLFLFIGMGMWVALLFIYADSYLGWGHQIALAYSLSFCIGALSLWAWYKLANCLGKNVTLGVSALMCLIGIFTTGLLSAESNWLGLLLSMTLFYSGTSALYVIAPSLAESINPQANIDVQIGVFHLGCV